MRYRIEVVTYQSGKVEYYLQYKVFFGWKYISSSNLIETGSLILPYSSREGALRGMDVDYKNRMDKKLKSVEFEYFNKP